jgi:hypothetical protein
MNYIAHSAKAHDEQAREIRSASLRRSERVHYPSDLPGCDERHNWLLTMCAAHSAIVGGIVAAMVGEIVCG